MDFTPSTLDSAQFREQVRRQIEDHKERPFADVLEAWLRERWEACPKSRDASWHLSPLSMMLRREDVDRVQKLTGKFKEIEEFYLYWNSGLFAEA